MENSCHTYFCLVGEPMIFRGLIVETVFNTHCIGLPHSITMSSYATLTSKISSVAQMIKVHKYALLCSYKPINLVLLAPRKCCTTHYSLGFTARKRKL